MSVFETVEEDKRKIITDAYSFSDFVGKFETVENNQNIPIQFLNDDRIIDFIGICDYDAIAITYARNSNLVSGEMITSEVSRLDEIKINVLGVADFISKLEIPIMEMFEIVKDMIRFHLYATITPTSIMYICSSFDEADELSKKTIIDSWKEVLNVMYEIEDENCRSKFKMACLKVTHLLRENYIYFNHPIVNVFVSFAMCFNDYRVMLKTENGNLNFAIVKIDEECQKDESVE